MSHLHDGPRVTAPLRTNIVPLTGVWNPPSLPSPLKNWEPVDPVVADPVRQDNDKRNNIQIYTEIPY